MCTSFSGSVERCRAQAHWVRFPKPGSVRENEPWLAHAWSAEYLSVLAKSRLCIIQLSLTTIDGLNLAQYRVAMTAIYFMLVMRSMNNKAGSCRMARIALTTT